MINQRGLTIRTYINPGEEDSLRKLLNLIGDDVIRIGVAL